MSRPLRLALLIVAIGAALRLAAVGVAHPQRLVGDEKYYVDVAANLAEGRGHLFERDGIAHRAFRPPLHPWLLSIVLPPEEAAAVREASSAPLRMLLLQAALGSLLVGATIALGRALFDWPEGLLAGAIAAVDPTLVAHSHYLWSETLSALLLGGAFAAVAASERAASTAAAAAAGVCFGAAALTREVALPIAAACALWAVASSPAPRGAALRRAALWLALATAIVAPWTIRNARLLDRFVPVATVGAFAAREGNTLPATGWLRTEIPALKAFRARYFAIPDEGARLDLARGEAAQLVRFEQPLWLAKKLVRTVAQLWSPDSYLLLKLSRRAYGDLAPRLLRPLLVASSAAYVVLVAGAILGAAGAAGRGRRALPALVVGVFFAVHVLANASPRFRLPLVPLLMVYASHAALQPRPVAARLRGGAGVTAAALLVLFLGLAVAPFLGEAASLWTRGTYRSAEHP